VRKNSVRTQKTPQPKRKVRRYEISQYTKPETAAKKIITKFGDEFGMSQVHQVGMVLTNIVDLII
jgi:hypothetical protein